MIEIINNKNNSTKRIQYSKEGLSGEAYLLFELREADKQAYVTKTFVDESFRGQGIGQILVEELIKYCQAEGLKVLSVCSYVTKLMSRKDEWKAFLLEESIDNACSI